jgi:hypothetical protein
MSGMACGLAWRAVVFGFALAATACRQSAAEARFAKDFHCDKITTEEISGGKFRVSGCGTEAIYTCTNKVTGEAWDNEIATTSLTCTREAATETSHHESAPSEGAQPAPQRKGSVARLVDEASGAHGVTAELPLLQQGMPGPWLRLETKPGDDPNRVWVTITTSARQAEWASCNAFALVVSGVAVPATAPQRSNQGAVTSIRSPYEGRAFEPMTHKNPTLGVSACSSTFALPDDELTTLQKFIAIRAELTPSAAPAGPAPTTPQQNPDASSAAGSAAH